MESCYFYPQISECMNSFADDDLIDALEAELPASNCGGCGLPGCRSFAEMVAGSGGTGSLFCSVGGTEVMHRLHHLLANRHP